MINITIFIKVGAYHASGGDSEEDRGDDGAEELGGPVEESADEGDAAADEGTKSDGGVDVAARDIEGHGDGDEEGERVSECLNDQTSSRGAIR